MFLERVMSLKLTAFSLGSAVADYQLSYTRNFFAKKTIESLFFM